MAMEVVTPLLEIEHNMLDESEYMKLRQVMFPESLPDEDVLRWLLQTFEFCEEPPFGLRQSHGGPCGVLAAIQAELIRYLFFKNKLNDCFHHMDREFQIKALFISIVTILSRISRTSKSTIIRIVIPTPTSDLSQLPYLDSARCPLICYNLNNTNLDQVRDFLISNSNFFLSSTGGILLFCYSMILTRGYDLLSSDLSGAALTGQFGHCNQELINLLLTGVATSHTINGDVIMDGIVLHGVPAISKIGYLSQLECLHYIEVGSNFKFPTDPTWLIASSSHITLLFSLESEVNSLNSDEIERLELYNIFSSLDDTRNAYIPSSQWEILVSLLLSSTVMNDKVKGVLNNSNQMNLLKDNMILYHTQDAAAGAAGTPPSSSSSAAGGNREGILLWTSFLNVILKLQRGVAVDALFTSTSGSTYVSSSCDCTCHVKQVKKVKRSDSEIAQEMQNAFNSGHDYQPPIDVVNLNDDDEEEEKRANREISGCENCHGKHDAKPVGDGKMKRFKMFHYNGQIPKLTQFYLIRNANYDEFDVAYTPSISVNTTRACLCDLEEILRTRWPDCEVDWEGAPFAKIE